MITRVLQGDLLRSRSQTLVNTVNTVGVMGKGIALEFKRRFPDMYADYEARARSHLVRLGEPYLYKRPQPPWIVNFPTKGHWRSVSRLSDIESGLSYLAEHIAEWGIESLAVPPLGCGNGQLEWRVVGPTIQRYLDRLPIPVELYAPLEVPPYQATLEFIAGKAESLSPDAASTRIRPEWLTITDVIDRIGRKPYAWPVGRTRLQKIAYLLTASGVPTGLRFAKGSYGPFSTDLKAAVARLVNNGLLVETQRGRMFTMTPGTTWMDARYAYAEQMSPYSATVERVAELMTRLDDMRSEVVATVHFTAKQLRDELAHEPTELGVLEAVMTWKVRRRPPLAEREVAEAIRNLMMLGWIDVTTSSGLPIDDDILVVA